MQHCEGQWDFNDPASVPGFGVHAAADYLGSLAAHGVGSLDTAARIPAESSQVVEQPASEGPGPICSEPAHVAGQITAAVPDASRDAAVGTLAGDTDDAELPAQHSVSEGDLGPRITRSHGGALPE
jgi:hypothetical protein